MVHVLEHLGEGLGRAGHLHPDVEALRHAQALHHVAQLLAPDVHGARGAHLRGEPQPVVVHVGDHDVARAHVAGDGGGHDADGAGARDEHVLAHEVEGEGGVRGVAERVEDRGEVVGDVVGDAEGVEGRDDEVLGEGALAVHAHAHGVAAQVPAAGAAVAAEAAGDVALAGDAVADREAAHLDAHVDDLAHVLVAHLHRHGDRLLRPVVPLPDVHVGAADRRLADADEDVVVPHLGLLHAREREAGGAFELRERLHGVT